MSKTSNVFARVEPELKEQAERIFNQLGLPMSNAITLFLRQVVLNRGVPFALTLPQKPKSLHEYAEEDFDKMIEQSDANIEAGRRRPAREFFHELTESHKERYGI